MDGFSKSKIRWLSRSRSGISNYPQLLHREQRFASEAFAAATNIAHALSLVLGFLAVCAIPAAAIGAETPPLKPAKINGAPADANGRPPLIIRNPDGTMTVQKLPAPENTEDAAQNGLVIPPQVVVPFVSAPANDRRNEAR